MKTVQLYKNLEAALPQSLCCEWDNDGLSVLPHKYHESDRILIALDARGEVIDYAEKNGFSTMITHHPLLFSKLSELTGRTVPGEKAVRLIRANIAAMSFHTRFDAAEGGVSDVLCKTLGMTPYKSFGEGGCELEPVAFGELAAKAKRIFGPAHFFCEKATDTVRRAAVCGGSAGDLCGEAIAEGADVIICGEMRYHSATDAADAGLNVICVGHYESEAPALRRLEEFVKEAGGGYTEIYEVSRYAV